MPVNGAYRSEEIFCSADMLAGRLTLTDDPFMILSDDREDLHHSRAYGVMDKAALEGKVIFIFRRRGFSTLFSRSLICCIDGINADISTQERSSKTMKKTIRQFLSLALALVMCLSLIPSALALEASTADGATSVTASKTLTMNIKAVPADVTFTFTLSSATEDDGTNATKGTSNYTVYPGDLEGVTLAADASAGYAAHVTNPTANQVSVKFNAGDTFTEATDTKSLTKSFNIDFSGVEFEEPGVYRYKLTEEEAPNGYSVVRDSVTTYYIDVYVEYLTDTATDLTIGGIVMVATNHSDVGAGTSDGVTKATTAVFENEKDTYDLTVTKLVSGNQGSRNKPFTFTVKVDGIQNGTYSYTVDGGKTYKSATADGGKFTIEEDLKHNQTMVFKDLPKGAKISVEETSYATDGYTTTWAATEADTTDTDNTASGNSNGSLYTDTNSGMTGDTVVTFTNTKSGTIPTGVLLTIAPFAALMVVGLAGVVLVLKKKKN